MLHIAGTTNPADIFTKLLGRELFERHMRALGVCATPGSARASGRVKFLPERFTELD